MVRKERDTGGEKEPGTCASSPDDPDTPIVRKLATRASVGAGAAGEDGQQRDETFRIEAGGGSAVQRDQSRWLRGVCGDQAEDRAGTRQKTGRQPGEDHTRTANPSLLRRLDTSLSVSDSRVRCSEWNIFQPRFGFF